MSRIISLKLFVVNIRRAVFLKPLLWWISAKKQPILGHETSQKKNTTKIGKKKNTTFGFKIKKFETNLKPLWVSKKLTKNQIYILKSNFDNEKLHVFEKITRQIFQKKTCLFFEDMTKKWQLKQKCANFTKKGLVSN